MILFNKFLRFLGFAIIILFFAGYSSAQKNKGTKNKKWKLVWSDEFNYIGLPDSTKWKYDTEGNAANWGNFEDQQYTFGKFENGWVENGKLYIIALKKETEGKKYSSVRLNSKEAWQFGRIEISAKLPDGRGTWPAIWMMPGGWSFKDGNWPTIGEIDIMENVGFDPDSIVGTAHTKKYNHTIGTQKGARIYCPNNYTAFHVYALEWEPKEYRLYLDDILYFTFKNENTGFDVWPFDKPFHLILNLAIGGNWGGAKGIDNSIFPQKFEVDYVRVYQH